WPSPRHYERRADQPHGRQSLVALWCDGRVGRRATAPWPALQAGELSSTCALIALLALAMASRTPPPAGGRCHRRRRPRHRQCGGSTPSLLAARERASLLLPERPVDARIVDELR